MPDLLDLCHIRSSSGGLMRRVSFTRCPCYAESACTLASRVDAPARRDPGESGVFLAPPPWRPYMERSNFAARSLRRAAARADSRALRLASVEIRADSRAAVATSKLARETRRGLEAPRGLAPAH